MIRFALARITPADAGKTFFAFWSVLSGGDHPRGCGENVIQCKKVGKMQGSPPRMRGKLIDLSQFADLIGDHPRGCGENLFV